MPSSEAISLAIWIVSFICCVGLIVTTGIFWDEIPSPLDGMIMAVLCILTSVAAWIVRNEYKDYKNGNRSRV